MKVLRNNVISNVEHNVELLKNTILATLEIGMKLEFCTPAGMIERGILKKTNVYTDTIVGFKECFYQKENNGDDSKPCFYCKGYVIFEIMSKPKCLGCSEWAFIKTIFPNDFLSEKDFEI